MGILGVGGQRARWSGERCVLTSGVRDGVSVENEHGPFRFHRALQYNFHAKLIFKEATVVDAKFSSGPPKGFLSP